MPSKKITQFETRGIVRVGAVDRVPLDVAGPFLADGPFLRICRIVRWCEFCIPASGTLPHDGLGIYYGSDYGVDLLLGIPKLQRIGLA